MQKIINLTIRKIETGHFCFHYGFWPALSSSIEIIKTCNETTRTYIKPFIIIRWKWIKQIKYYYSIRVTNNYVWERNISLICWTQTSRVSELHNLSNHKCKRLEMLENFAKTYRKSKLVLEETLKLIHKTLAFNYTKPIYF